MNPTILETNRFYLKTHLIQGFLTFLDEPDREMLQMDRKKSKTKVTEDPSKKEDQYQPSKTNVEYESEQTGIGRPRSQSTTKSEAKLAKLLGQDQNQYALRNVI